MRKIGVGLLVAWIVGGPMLHQGMGVNNPFLPAWHMYRGWGSNIVVVELTRVDRGTPERLDRLALLGFDDAAPPDVRRLKSPEDLERQVRHLCAALPPGADLRVKAKIGRSRGWKVLRKGRKNACR